MFEIDFYTENETATVKHANERVLTSTEDWEKQVWQFVIDWFNPAIETISIFTSGSTGAPKKIEHTKASMLYSASLTCTVLNLKPGNKALLCLPVNKISGMMMVVRSIYQKMWLTCIKPSTTPLLNLTDEQHFDFAAFTPMQFHGITNNYSCFEKAGRIKKIILGGEDIGADLALNILKLKTEVYITFGMTETISHIALKRLNGAKPDENFKVLPGIAISTDKRSCLTIGAPMLGQPHLVTNDVVSIEGPNEFRWLGRIDNVINSGGIKIYPEDIEQQLAKAIDAPYFITSKPDLLTGQKLVLILEKATLKPEEIIELKAAFSKLEKMHCPKQVLLVPQFSRTTNGKIKRSESVLKPIATIEF